MFKLHINTWCFGICLLFALQMGEELKAEEFLGVEGEVDAEEVQKNSSRSRKPRSNDSDDSPDAGRWMFGLGLGARNNGFTGSFSLGYFSNEYLGTQISGFYESFSDDLDYMRLYGGELALIVRLPNPTMVTPFIGAGPGYENWERVYQDIAFDDSYSMTFVTFAGINIRFSKYFGLTIKRKLTAYVTDVPISYKDRTTKEDNMQWQTLAGFYAGF